MSDRWCQECGCVEYECHCDYPLLGAGDDEPQLHRLSLQVCDLCLDGEGGECHVPGCAFWMHAAPMDVLLDVLRNAKPLQSVTAGRARPVLASGESA